MINRTFCLLFSLLLINDISAQCDSSFFRQIAVSVYDVSLVDSNIIIAVGSLGNITKSKDGGKSWKNIETFNRDNLWSVQMVTDNIGYAVGDNTILKTEDQGESWFPITIADPESSNNSPVALKDLYFFNKDHGFVVGNNGLIISTIDGGRSWSRVPSLLSASYNSITFTSDSVGFIVSDPSGALFKTINGGRSWDKILINAVDQFQRFRKIKFINSATGFIVGYSGLCLKTDDGGVSWTKINTPTSGEYFDIFFLNEKKGFIVGSYSGGVILQSDDGGNTWKSDFNYPSRSASYYCINADPGKGKIIIAGGGDFYSGGSNGRHILSTINAGTTYTSLSSNGKHSYKDMFFLNDSTGYMAGEEGLVHKTSDFGESWKPLQYVPSSNSGSEVSKIFFLDSKNGFAATNNIYKTTDGGETWNMKTTPGMQEQYVAKQMYFLNTQKGFVQDGQTIYKTINGGTTWTNVATSSTFYKDFTITSAGKAFSVGYGGTLDVSTDEGTTWTSFNLNTDKYLTSVYFYNSNLGFIGTADTTIFKTTDGGNTWMQINTGFDYIETQSFHFVSENEGYMVASNNGGSSWVYKTRNGGLSWYYVSEQSEISGIVGFNKLYYSGGSGLVARLDNLQKPGIPGYISGTGKGCVGSKSAFITGKMEGVDYNWTLAGGGSNTYTANLDTVLWNSAGVHTLSVSISNTCGTSPLRYFTTEVVVFQPTITVRDSVLTATEGLSYQWYRNDYPIPGVQGGNSRNLVGQVTGTYTVAVKGAYGCTVQTPAVNFSAIKLQAICSGDSTYIFSYAGGNAFQWQLDDGTGFVNISDNGIYTGTKTTLLKIKNIPSSWYGYKFRCITNLVTSDITALQILNTWTGTVNGTWENSSNWSCGKVPDENTDVVINSGTVIINSNVVVRKMTINPGVNLTVLPGNTLTITH